MVKKSRRSIYDPSLNPEDGLFRDSSSDDYYYDDDDMLCYLDEDFEEQEWQSTSEILGSKLNSPRRSSRSSRFCIAFLICIGIVAVVVTSNAFIRTNKTYLSDMASAAPLAAPPTDLADICSKESVDSAIGGRDRCDEACKASDCCYIPVNLDLSCLSGNGALCQDYHKWCTILEEKGTLLTNVDIPPAPKNLGEICNMELIATLDGMRRCAEHCLPQKCCYELAGQSCRTHDNCISYSPCHNLRAYDNIHQKIVIEIEATCGNPRLSVNCAEACQTSECCFDPNIDCELNDDEETFCRQYQACGVVWLADDDGTFVNNGAGATQDDGVSLAPTMEPTMLDTFLTPEPTLVEN